MALTLQDLLALVGLAEKNKAPAAAPPPPPPAPASGKPWEDPVFAPPPIQPQVNTPPPALPPSGDEQERARWQPAADAIRRHELVGAVSAPAAPVMEIPSDVIIRLFGGEPAKKKK